MAFLIPLGIEFIEGALGAEGLFEVAGGAASLGISGVSDAVGTGIGASVTDAVSGTVGTGLGNALGDAISGTVTTGLVDTAGTIGLSDTVIAGTGEEILSGGEILGTIGTDSGATAIDSTLIDSQSGNVLSLDEEVFGSSVTLDDSAEILAPEILDLTKQGIIDTLRNALADVGITEELLGAQQWNKLVALASGGAITVDELVKFYDSNNLQETVEGHLDNLVKNKDGIGSPNGYLFIDSLGNPVNVTDFLNGSIKEIIDPYYIGYSTGKLAVSTGYEMSKTKGIKMNKNLILSTLKAVNKNDEYAFIAKKMMRYMSSQEYIKDPLKFSNTYNYYYQIYDGKYLKEPYLDTDGKYAALDETGKKHKYVGSRGVHNILGYEVNNPTLHGVYVGPLSPNNSLPIDSFDRAAFFHDCNYDEGGFFHYEADFILVSEVQHILDDPVELAKYSNITIAKMKFTVWWFSNISPILSSLYNQNEHADNKITDILHANQGSFFDMILGQYDKKNQKESLDLPEEYFWIRRKARSYAEKQFLDGLEEGINQQYKYYSELFLVEQARKNLDNITIYG